GERGRPAHRPERFQRPDALRLAATLESAHGKGTVCHAAPGPGGKTGGRAFGGDRQVFRRARSRVRGTRPTAVPGTKPGLARTLGPPAPGRGPKVDGTAPAPPRGRPRQSHAA